MTPPSQAVSVCASVGLQATGRGQFVRFDHAFPPPPCAVISGRWALPNEAVLDHWLKKWSRCSHWDLWFGWGANGCLRDRDRWLLDRVEALVVQRHKTGGMGAFCLGRTRAGHPRHPLYLPASAQPQPWFAAESPRIRHPVAMVPAGTVHP